MVSSDLSCVTVVLPSLNPDEKLQKTVASLLAVGFTDLVLVNDGSRADTLRFFPAEDERITVLRHEVNRGKGAALKTAFRYVLDHRPASRGVVTVDGDGQHRAEDVRRCAETMLADGEKIIFGCRDFSLPHVPRRSWTGNRITSAVFRIFCGLRLSDTQTGLRAIPRQYLKPFCGIEGERFEYETNMLLNMKRMGIGFAEQPITTVYDPEDYSSHYDAVKDSWRIFKVMFKFLMSSLGSTVIDLTVFYLVMRFFGAAAGKYAELLSTAVARALSSFANFNANNAVVFENHKGYKRALLRYYCLCIPQMLVSAGLVTLINHLLSNSLPLVATLIKFAVDICLFFISYQIQREWVFSQKK